MYALRCMWRLRRSWPSDYGASHLVYLFHINTSLYISVLQYLSISPSACSLQMVILKCTPWADRIPVFLRIASHLFIAKFLRDLQPIVTFGNSFGVPLCRAGWRNEVSFGSAVHSLYSYIVFLKIYTEVIIYLSFFIRGSLLSLQPDPTAQWCRIQEKFWCTCPPRSEGHPAGVCFTCGITCIFPLARF